MKPSRLLRPILTALIAATALGIAGRADAVTLEDIIGLTRAGLSDEVLVALVETDGTVFTLTPAQLVQLKDAGVSERVMVAMLWQGRTPIPESTATSEPPVTPDMAPFDQSRDTSPSAPSPASITTVVVVPAIVPWPYFVQVPHRSFVSVPPPPTSVPPPGFGRFMNTFGRFINDGFPR